jgi:hypothetical protein
VKSKYNNWHNFIPRLKSSSQRTTITANTIVVLLLILVIVTANTILSFPLRSLAQVNSIPVNPSNTRGTPPQIVMLYTSKEYHGTLIRYITNNTSPGTGNSPTLGESLITPTNITTPTSSVVYIKRGSSISFIVKNTSTIGYNSNYTDKNLANSLPNSLSITAYDLKGKPVKLLNTTEKSSKSSASVNLNPGQYILMAVATWLPQQSDKTRSAFVSYKYDINVVS